MHQIVQQLIGQWKRCRAVLCAALLLIALLPHQALCGPMLITDSLASSIQGIDDILTPGTANTYQFSTDQNSTFVIRVFFGGSYYLTDSWTSIKGYLFDESNSIVNPMDDFNSPIRTQTTSGQTYLDQTGIYMVAPGTYRFTLGANTMTATDAQQGQDPDGIQGGSYQLIYGAQGMATYPPHDNHFTLNRLTQPMEPAAVPVPATAMLLSTGLASLGLLRKQKEKKP